MANGYFERGEIYWVSISDMGGNEVGGNRPGLILSTDRLSASGQVVIAYLTTSDKEDWAWCVPVNATGRRAYVKCDTLMTVRTSRLKGLAGVLNSDEQKAVDDVLEKTLDLGYTDDAAIKAKDCEIELRDVTISTLNEQVAILKMEIEMWQKCYGRCMDMLVDLKVSGDVACRTASEEQSVPVVEEAPKPPVIEEPEPEKVDLNSCSVIDLKKCGCTEAIAELIIAGRPYTFVDELTRIPGVTNVGFNILKHKVCVIPVVEEEEPEEEKLDEESVEVEEPAPVKQKKININTVTRKELQEKLGIGEFYAYLVTGYRNKNGRYVSLEELLEVPNLSKSFYHRFKDRLTIDDEDDDAAVSEAEEPPVEKKDTPEQEENHEPWGGKVNVNTATVEELVDRTQMSSQTAASIVAYRKKHGPFPTLDSLLLVNRFGTGCLKAYGDMLTVGEDVSLPEKVNINKASLRELMAVGFEKRAAALIVHERKVYGNFRSLDELSEIPGITGKVLRKLRDKLEV